MAKDVSEIEDGFALKLQRDNGKRGKKQKLKGEHTIPPPPVKHILSTRRPTRSDHALVGLGQVTTRV